MSFTKPSIHRNLLLSFLGFGLLMGALFPFYAGFFVEWKEGMYPLFVGGTLVAGLTIGMANYIILKVVLLTRLKRISEVANAISHNDISHHCSMQSHDLIGDIIDSFNKMAENLRHMIGMIDDVTNQLGNSAEHLTQVTDETDRSVQHQQAETTQAATAMNQMVATVQEVAHNTGQAAEAANSATQEAQAGALVATEAIGSIEKLSGDLKTAVTVIDKVKDENSNIHSVLDVIRDITEQTNLLALNAAIEAARAGEQGRGFAVVADEVRTLAQRTQESTLEIQDMIERLNQQVEAAVNVMGEASDQASDSESKVENAAISLGEIAGSVRQINDMNIQIASAAVEQSAVAEEVSRNVSNINEASERSAESMRQAATATDELNELAEQLRALIGQFRIGNRAAASE